MGNGNLTAITGLALIWCLGCPAQPLTEVIVVIDTNLGRDVINWVHVEVVESTEIAGQFVRHEPIELPFSADRQPLAVGLVYRGGPLGPVFVTVRGSLTPDGERVIRRVASFAFMPNEVRVIRLDLLAECLNVSCEHRGESCLPGGECGGNQIGVGQMLPWDGRVDPRDINPLPQPQCQSSEICNNNIDDNCNGVTDENTDDGNDPNNCGWCGNNCSSNNCLSRACDDDLVDIAAGSAHTCALVMETGGVFCWGKNLNGQLGTGDTWDTNHFMIPTTALGNSGARRLAAGDHHNCALLGTAEVVCWGNNNEQQLGSTNTDSVGPLKVSVGDNAKDVTAGKSHSCALLNKGKVACWGAFDSGQTGHNDSPPGEVEPLGMDKLPEMTMVSAGRDHTCALDEDGLVWCWGDNSSGQLGRDTPEDYSPAASVVLGLKATLVAAGGSHTCAAPDSGGVVCWGNNDRGQLGDGTKTRRSQPQKTLLPADHEAIWLTAGANHTCAIVNDGRGFCWGANSTKQLGVASSSAAVTTPEEIKGIPSNMLVRLSAGVAHTCSRALGGVNEGIYCWGSNLDKQANYEEDAPPTLSDAELVLVP
jgi:alpha-tubulin suppressor-like RCC1 family protein